MAQNYDNNNFEKWNSADNHISLIHLLKTNTLLSINKNDGPESINNLKTLLLSLSAEYANQKDREKFTEYLGSIRALQKRLEKQNKNATKFKNQIMHKENKEIIEEIENLFIQIHQDMMQKELIYRKSIEGGHTWVLG